MDIRDISAAVVEITAPGQPYEMIEASVNGVAARVFKHAPENLRELYESSLVHADKDCYVYLDERYSFAAMWDMAARVAAALDVRGFVPGDRIAIAARNYPEWLFAYMGITSLGCVAVALNAWWTGEELAYGITDSGAKLVFTDGERLERLLPLQGELGIELVSLRTTAPNANVGSWQDFLAATPQMPRTSQLSMTQVPIAADALATILYTSGSTARPKGVQLTHRGIIHAVLGWECGAAIAVHLVPELLDPDPEFPPAMILSVPMFHVAGMHVQFMSSFRIGRKLVGMYKWDPERALEIIQSERITQFNGVPTMSWELIQSSNFDRYDLRSLKGAGGGGSPMAPEHARQIDARLPAGVVGTGWGMTETNGLGTAISGADLLERPGSCGRPIPPVVEIKVVDEDDQEVARGESGELWVRGAMNFTGYWNQPEATAETLSDGWLRTGDIGHMDEQDFVFITDRAKDMVIRGGENIGCQEVEAAIYEHPAVSECAVFGLPDERLGETLAAVIMHKPGQLITGEEIRAHVAEHLARFKVPDHVWVQAEQLPRIASGKIFKRGLRDDAIAALNHANGAPDA
jgi:acyl-CoA synthetase (AMP-forming)/AMP-acid ligase II